MNEAKRMDQNKQKKGRIIVFNGISGSGKTILAEKLIEYLKEKNKPVFLMDGDLVRNFFGNDLKFSIEDRLRACKRVAFGTSLLSDNGINVIMAVVMGQKELRDFYKSKLDFVEILLDADIKDCIKNDPKGMYARNLKLKKPNITGYDLPFYRPENPDLIIYPYKETPEQSFEKIISFLKEKKVI